MFYLSSNHYDRHSAHLEHQQQAQKLADCKTKSNDSDHFKSDTLRRQAQHPAAHLATYPTTWSPANCDNQLLPASNNRQVIFHALFHTRSFN